MAGDNPVIPLDVFEQPPGDDPFRLEQLALQLTPAGALTPLHLDNAIWGSEIITEYRLGTDGAFHQLRTSRTNGVQIVRYPFSAPAAPAPPSNATTAQPAPTSQPAATAASAPPATPPAAQPAPDSGSRAWLASTGATLLTALVILGGALLIRRRRRRPSAPGTPPDYPPTADGPLAPDDPPHLSRPPVGSPSDTAHHGPVPQALVNALPGDQLITSRRTA
jgi:hypothetical protein